ncbi:DUF3299 domain-containing protein [Salipiger bermudensis]|uniref:DUF3299 domain-containing protein n=1 Tax=Salipiger bermudensis TaxID=344736 RepID=UPI001C9990E7|nr:DUF3299 domain-containing protein [Salipiger bermudensis]MBY6006683.1 DUF3299 domain-containing protein [Salipiger bermudensis]
MRILVLAMIGMLSAGVSSADSLLRWADLIDPSAQVYDDPYRDLSYDQIEALATVARLRNRLESGSAEDSGAQLQAQLDEAEADLTAAGIDIDWLISQRWVVAERRERAAKAGNPAVDGAEVVLAGFAVPGPLDDDGAPTAYLVPAAGMCSHMPPPPPNQMIRLHMPFDWTPGMMHEPMRVSGHLSIEPSERHVMVVDGIVPMRATFAMEVEALEASGRGTVSSQATGMATNEWAAQIAERLRAAKGSETDGN